jgi:thioredoxin 1
MKKFIIVSSILLTSLLAGSQEIVFLNEAVFKAKVWNYDQNPEWKFIGDKPMIIDFYADWCKPCKMIAPYLSEIQSEYGNKLQIYKINTDNTPALANLFKVRSIPTLLFVPADGNFKQIVGYRDKAQFVDLIETVLKVTK